jgi:hypothetical protein
VVEVSVLRLVVVRKNTGARQMAEGWRRDYQDNLWSSWIVGMADARSLAARDRIPIHPAACDPKDYVSQGLDEEELGTVAPAFLAPGRMFASCLHSVTRRAWQPTLEILAAAHWGPVQGTLTPRVGPQLAQELARAMRLRSDLACSPEGKVALPSISRSCP